MTEPTEKCYEVTANLGIASEGALYDKTSKADYKVERKYAISLVNTGQIAPVGLCNIQPDDKADNKDAKFAVIFGRVRTRASRLIDKWTDGKPEDVPVEINKERLEAWPGLWVSITGRPLNPVAVILAENVFRKVLSPADRNEMATALMVELEAAGASLRIAIVQAADMLEISAQTIRNRIKAADLGGKIPEVQLAMEEAKLSTKDAAALSSAITKAEEKVRIASKSDKPELKAAAKTDLDLAYENARQKAKEASEKAEGKRAAKKPGKKAVETGHGKLVTAILKAPSPYLEGARDFATWVMTGVAPESLEAYVPAVAAAKDAAKAPVEESKALAAVGAGPKRKRKK